MKRSMLAAVVAVGLVVPASAQATTRVDCTPGGVQVTFFGFDNPGVHDVRWGVARDGVVLESGVSSGHGSWVVDVPVSAGPVVVTDWWSDGVSVTPGVAGCVPPVAPPPDVPPVAPPPGVPPFSPPEPPVKKPPVKKPVARKSCADLLRSGAGRRWLVARGCVSRRPRPRVRVCPPGERRSVVRVGGAVYQRCTPGRRDVLAVTG